MRDRQRILIVDDEPEVLKALGRLFGLRFEVVVAEDAAKGYAAASEETFDLIILDVTMPGVDGRTLASMLREQPSTRGMPILMLTGLSSREDLEEGYAAGADEYMTKPFDVEALWASANRLIAAKPI